MLKIFVMNISKIINGIIINDLHIYAKHIFKGRFSEETNLNIYIKQSTSEHFLLSAKIFHGRKPYYKPWIEIFNINDKIIINNKTLIYFDSNIEDTLLSFFSQLLNPGESIYIEYYNDLETKEQLNSSIPPVISRLGYKLFTLGFTWFKDWYFPEGFMEGDMKLQGEKPLNETFKKIQLKKIFDEIKIFLEYTRHSNKWYIIRARERGQNILKHLTITN